MICSPSFLSCDFSQLEAEIRSISSARWLHFDVMDGEFVTNKTYDHRMLHEMKGYACQFFDVHLMIQRPEEHYQDYIDNNADLITFHLEATQDPKQLISDIQEQGVKAGISIKPATPVESLDPLLPDLDLVLIMSVEPGRGGQKFLESALDKIKYLDKKRKENGYRFLIEVDGGINFETAKAVKKVGCDVIVVGSFIFNQRNRRQVIEALEDV